jgi:peptidyl-prolyl cis-trans isomerase SurA|tara:strand:- start:677 stop:1534 length:858 start_codon:yes stop_codon:yes gene_type:complete
MENKILFKIEKKIITTQDILNEVNYLKLINSEFKSFDNNKIYVIAKNSLIREIIKENELKRIFKKVEIKENFIEQFIIDYFSKFKINSINELKQILEQNNLNLDNIKKKITIQIMWNDLIFEKFSKNVKINKDIIKKEISLKKTQEEYLISEIVFSVNNKKDLKNKFEKIKIDIKENNFSKAAIIHSISETSINGGKIGWVTENSLSLKIKDAFNKLKIGDITKPIRIPGAFIILKIEDKRNIELELDFNKEFNRIVKRKTNEQLNQFSNIYFNKIKKDVKVNEL